MHSLAIRIPSDFARGRFLFTKECKMKRLLRLLVIGYVLSLAGCTCYDALYSVAGDAYEGGGRNSFDKEFDYDEKVRAAGDAALINASENQ
jgi:hypothetical protein